jgi:hypothetical protein
MLDINCITRWYGGKVFVGVFEALPFKIGAHKRLDQARPGDILLQDGVQPVQLFLDDMVKIGSILMLKKTSTRLVITSSGSTFSVSWRLVLYIIKIRLPIIISGARVPMRSVTCTRRAGR